MANYQATVRSSWDQTDTFDYLADFRNVSEWDPFMQEATLIRGEPGKVGSAYRLVTSVLGRDAELVCEMIDVDRPHRLVVLCENDTLVSLDTITVRDDGSVTYHAQVDLHGLRKLADPVVQLGLTRASNQARDRLAESSAIRPRAHDHQRVERRMAVAR